MSTPHDYTQTVRTLYEAFEHLDADRLMQVLDPQVEWTSAENFIYADHSPYIGAKTVAQLLFGRLLVDWANFEMIPVEILGSGDIVIANGRFRGVYKVTGARVDAQFVQVFQFKDGKVSKCQVYTDTAQFKDAVTTVKLAGA